MQNTRFAGLDSLLERSMPPLLRTLCCIFEVHLPDRSPPVFVFRFYLLAAMRHLARARTAAPVAQ
jgi:hypothetical protein